MATVIELGLYALISGFSTSVAIALNEWLFKKRIEKALNKFETVVKEKIKNANNSKENGTVQ